MLLRTLTSEQIEVVQEIINENFEGILDDEQIPEALELTLEVIGDMINNNDEEVSILYLPSYIQVTPTVKRKNPPLAPPVVPSPEVPSTQTQYKKEPTPKNFDYVLDKPVKSAKPLFRNDVVLGSCRQNELGFEKKEQKRYKDCTKKNKRVLPCGRPIAASMN
ncbi:9310_t:CDS:2, partial [Racocetra persica]